MGFLVNVSQQGILALDYLQAVSLADSQGDVHWEELASAVSNSL